MDGWMDMDGGALSALLPTLSSPTTITHKLKQQAKKLKEQQKKEAEKKARALDASYKRQQEQLKKDAQKIRKEKKVGGRWLVGGEDGEGCVPLCLCTCLCVWWKEDGGVYRDVPLPFSFLLPPIHLQPTTNPTNCRGRSARPRWMPCTSRGRRQRSSTRRRRRRSCSLSSRVGRDTRGVAWCWCEEGAALCQVE